MSCHNLSWGQSVLLNIESMRSKSSSDTQSVNYLKYIYLMGVHGMTEDVDLAYLNIPLPESTEASLIDEDPTRRYFETHLSYETLKNNLQRLNVKQLEAYFSKVYNVASALVPKAYLDGYQVLSKGNIANNELSGMIDAINMAWQFRDLFILDACNKKKIEYIFGISYLIGLLMSFNDDKFPLKIYNSGFFKPKNRGRINKYPNDMSQPYSHNFGILKSYMPVPVKDKAYSDKIFSYQKPTDSSRYDINKKLIKYQFSSGIHPFCNSISGIMLMQLRFLLYAIDNDTGNGNPFGDLQGVMVYFRCFIALWVYSSGGHSLFEYSFVMQLQKVKQAFETKIPGFNTINFKTLFYDNNQKAVNTAINSTILYNSHIIQRANVRKELLGNQDIVMH